MIRALIALLTLLMLSTGAEAYCGSWGYRHAQQQDWPFSVFRQRYCRHWVSDDETRVYAYERRYDEDRRDGRHCQPMQRVVGNQHLTVDGAKRAADEAWAGDVRFRFGEIYMTLDNARGVTYTCSRSSIKEGGVTTLGQTLSRCEILATPCRAPQSEPMAPPQDRDER